MQNQIENSKSQMTPQGYWNPSEQEEILKTLSVIVVGQKAYGKDVSVADVWAYHRMKLDGRFPASHVLAALGLYTDRKNDVPAPADLIALMILPDAAKITTAEYIAARDVLKQSGYFNSYSTEAQLIRDYEKQQAEDRQPIRPIEDPKVLSIVQDSIKRIT